MTKSRSKQDTRRDGTRYYYIDRDDGSVVKLPSVTTILQVIGKPALLNWMASEERKYVTATAADLYEDVHGTPKLARAVFLDTLARRLKAQKAGDRAKKKAAEIGSNVHALCEWTLKRELYGAQHVEPEPTLATEAAKQAFAAWQDWRATVHLKPLAIEQTVWSFNGGYAGTMDLWAEVDGQQAVIDWKTGKGIYPEYRLQAAAYAHALREMRHADKPTSFIVRLPKTPADGFEVCEVPYAEHADLMTVFNGVRELWQWLNGFKYERKRPKPAADLHKLSASIDAAQTPTRLKGLVADNKALLDEANDAERAYIEAQVAAKWDEFERSTVVVK